MNPSLKCIVTGGAGFIGSHLVDALLEKNHKVIAIDNLVTGQIPFLKNASQHQNFRFENEDLFTGKNKWSALFKNADIVFHLAANADVRFGTHHPTRDLEQNTIVTSNVLEAMREHNVKRIVFSSTGSIYGEPEVFPTPESAPFPVQTSLYGASKLAAEGLISAYCTGYGMTAWIFRFVSVLGERYSHGHVYDFLKQLSEHPEYLHVLGDGKQTKSYMYVKDCVAALSLSLNEEIRGTNIFNLGRDEVCTVRQSIQTICSRLQIDPELRFSGGSRGWIGDSPRIHLDCSKIEQLGWNAKTPIAQGLQYTVDYLMENKWLLQSRDGL